MPKSLKNSFMQRAIALAEQARGNCSPNPNVGAVIVKNDQIIGEGWTQACGCDHAEVQAIRNCRESCQDAEMFVTLEPCSHFGKTPPCAKAIIASGIKAVYIGIQDPNFLVAGKGIQMLKAAGIKVETGLCNAEISRQLETHITYSTKFRPFVTLKTAVSLDGRIAAPDGTSRWISCEQSRLKTHELRRAADAVLTGIGTIRKDNPLLNVRLENPFRQPLRVILDARYNFPLDSQIAQTAGEYPTLIFTGSRYANPAREEQLEDVGIEVCRIYASHNNLHLPTILNELYKRKITSVLVEAGNLVNTSFLQAGLVDKLVMFIAPKLLGGPHLAWDNIGIDNISQAL
ncbi:MAG: bifunctional diaminohydroxyphosphoribosylaminopyrimidine deaminase/5-amino-6-(5-phosphoribosylamino)uracil reductase RibD, partial [Candidatus Cloacimonadaceae bacterium]